MGDYGKFERSYLSQGRRYRALTRRYGYSMTKIAIFWKLPKIISTYFFVLSINHTCELELDIFFLGWDIIVQNFSSHSRSYKFLWMSPHYSDHFYFFDVITDKVHCQSVNNPLAKTKSWLIQRSIAKILPFFTAVWKKHERLLSMMLPFIFLHVIATFKNNFHTLCDAL